MIDPKKKLNAEQKKKLNSYIDELNFRNSVIKDYNKKGINILDKDFQNINFKNDTIVKVRGGTYNRKHNIIRRNIPYRLATWEIENQMRKFEQYDRTKIPTRTVFEKNKKTGKTDLYKTAVFKKNK